MKILYDRERLMRLVDDLQTFTGLKTCVFDSEGRDLQIYSGHQEFCRLINADPEGHRRCEACDARAVRAAAQAGGVYRYRCHLGLCEAALPLYENGMPIAYLAFGQYLDNSPKERQWEYTEQTLNWYEGDRKALREAFWALRQYSFRETAAYASIMQALTAYILWEGIIRSAEYTDLQRLEIYLDEHYRENIPLRRIAADLHMGTTKLCALAKQLPGGAHFDTGGGGPAGGGGPPPAAAERRAHLHRGGDGGLQRLQLFHQDIPRRHRHDAQRLPQAKSPIGHVRDELCS